MTPKKKKPNYFKIKSPRVAKLFWSFFSVLMALDLVMLVICVAQGISLRTSEPGLDIGSVFKGYHFFIEFMLASLIILFIGYCAIFLYVYVTNRYFASEDVKTEVQESPLQGAAAGHEEEIVALLKTIAQPLPSKGKLNRARTAQFLRALLEMELVDSNLTGKHLMAWVEEVTGYQDGNASHFQQALKDATPQDIYVADFRKQIEQIIAE